MKKALLSFIISLIFISPILGKVKIARQWTADQAQSWYGKLPFLSGFNYLPSTAINQIEMWQASTWDAATIDRELGWASEIGFNTARVFLHDLVYRSEKSKFLKRMDDFLTIADKHNIKVLFVFWDDCHYACPTLGKQPEMIPGVHNSGWKQSPGYHTIKAYSENTLDVKTKKELEKYVKAVLKRFKNDKRILGWDLYNELGQSDCGNYGIPLLEDTWKWAWEIRPSQPLTACVGGTANEQAKKINRDRSDIYSFHTYSGPDSFSKGIASVMTDAKGRPVICTEYMARPHGCTFQMALPIFKENNIANFCWGFVDGKSGTKWDWGTRRITAGAAAPIPTGDPSKAPKDPKLWFHDVLRTDGTPYINEEVEFIRSIMKK